MPSWVTLQRRKGDAASTIDGSSAIPRHKIAAFATLGCLLEYRFGRSLLRFICMLVGKVTSYLSRWMIAMGYLDYGEGPDPVIFSQGSLE
jgi:hypothetical protein